MYYLNAQSTVLDCITGLNVLLVLVHSKTFKSKNILFVLNGKKDLLVKFKCFMCKIYVLLVYLYNLEYCCDLLEELDHIENQYFVDS